MDLVLILLATVAGWQFLRLRYQRAHISLLGKHLAPLQLERHMETLTEGYTRAIHEDSQIRQLQVLESFAATEEAVAAQVRTLADGMQTEPKEAVSMGAISICLPYIERFFPAMTRDFRRLLQIHAAGLRYVVDNPENLDAKSRAFHLCAELFLFQHSCHWFCKSRTVADARLMLRHQVEHRKVLDSVSEPTRSAYLSWMQGSA